MREIRKSGSEGGGAEPNRCFLPLSRPSGSTGGTIGKQDKSVSGEKPRPAAPARKRRSAAVKEDISRNATVRTAPSESSVQMVELGSGTFRRRRHHVLIERNGDEFKRNLRHMAVRGKRIRI
jgi:hypothetical protein